MILSGLARVTVVAAALVFTGAALAFWIAPLATAERFGLAPSSAAGMATLRADLGGVFAGLALLCAAAFASRGARFAPAAALLMGSIAAGRLLSSSLEGGAAIDWVSLAVELTVLAALLVLAHGSKSVPAETGRRFGRRAAIAAATLIAIATAGVSLVAFSPAVLQGLFDRAARARTATINTALLTDDAMRVAICGSSAPLPSATRAKPCVAVFAGGKFYVVDAGPESVENLVLWGVPLSSIGGVLLTHFHSDHIGDLGELNLQTWAGGRPSPLDVYGGPGVEHVVDGFNRAYQLDQGYRTAHHSERVMPSRTWPMSAHPISLAGAASPEKNRTSVILDDGSLRVTAIEVDHAPIEPAYAYRFDYKGRSVVITGDYKYHPPLAQAASGADVLVSEAIAVSMTRSLGAGARSAGRDRTAAIMHDIEDYHITPEQAARIANDARVRLLVFYHLLPSPDGLLLRKLFARGVSDVRRGDWAIAEDGSLYTLPVATTQILMGMMR